MPPPPTRAAAAVVLVVCALFFAFAGDGLRAYFTPDDMMNLYEARFAGPAWVLHHRPVGDLLYRLLFALFGLSPLPYRLAAFALLLANLALLYRFCRRVAGSREVAALACLLAAYHAHLADLYYSTGTIYDLFCCFFLLSALAYYIGIRQAGLYPNARQTAWLATLYLLALGSKEMAVVLPVYILLYEWIFERDHARWLRHGAWFWWISLPLTAGYAAAKFTGSYAMIANPDFAQHFTLHAFLAGWRHYLNDLFYGAVAFNSFKTLLLLVLLLAGALWARRREMLFAWFIIVVGVLPVIFIPPRGFYVIYLTLPGWYLYGAAALTLARDAVLRGLPRWSAALRVRPEQAVLFLLVLVVLIPLDRREKPLGNSWVAPGYQSVRSVLEPLDTRVGALRPGARILFLTDPFDPGDWILASMFRLHYRDQTIQVDRVKDHPALAGETSRDDRVFVLDESGLREVLENPWP